MSIINEKRIFSTGLMRTGGSLIMNIISLTNNAHLFNERLNYFRFIHGHYNLSSPHQIELALEEFRIRLKYRAELEFDSKIVANNILNKGFSEAIFYDEVYKYFISPLGKSIWGEYANLSWRKIPNFFDMFPNGVVVVVMRDPRAIISSFKELTFLPGKLYLNIIFNWIDFINHLIEYQKKFTSKRLWLIKLEDLHLKPKIYVPELVDFIGEEFHDIMIQPEKWPDILDERFDKVNVSAHTKKKVYGFDPSRNDVWKYKLDQSEIELIELIAGKHIELAKYPLHINKKNSSRGLDEIKSLLGHPFLVKNYETFVTSGAGTDALPIDPRLPENWSSPEDPFKKFTDTQKYIDFCKETAEVKLNLNSKYLL